MKPHAQGANHQTGTGEPKLAPYQRTTTRSGERAAIAWAVHMRAYEVYCVVYGEQKALIDLEGRGCRGGFGTGELIAFLYASGFPREQWAQRVEEALKGHRA